MAKLYTLTSRKSSEEINPIVRHVDEWQRVSLDHRNTKLGQDWLDIVENFYQLTDQGGPMPSFRPLVRVPQLQTLMLQEANDLSDLAVRPYIINTSTGKRDEDREKGFQAEWKRSFGNYHVLFAILQSLFVGMCPVQWGWDPNIRRGRGGLWLKARDPRTFLPDPTTDYELNWSYVIAEDRMHLEEVKTRWGSVARNIKPRVAGRMQSPAAGESGYGFQLPPGPMATVPGLPSNRALPTDNRVRVRYVWCKDYTREKVEEDQLPEGAIVPEDFRFKYPDGRFLVECEGTILADGNNATPLGTFPFSPVWGLPPLYSIWSTPAIRYSLDMQNVAARLYTQMFENAVRLNNGVWFIPENTGIDPNLFGGLPGEVQVINANATFPQCVWPNPMPPHVAQLPQLLLDKQKELHGFTPARQGNPGAGNISTDLFDASVLKSQGMTQLRGRLLAISIQRIVEGMFYMMCRFAGQRSMLMPGTAKGEVATWPGRISPDELEMTIDESSIEPLSQTIIRKIAPDLAAKGIIPKSALLDAIGWPAAQEVAEAADREAALAALAKVRGLGRR